MRYEIMQKGIDINNDSYEINADIYEYMSYIANYTNPHYHIDDLGESYLGKKIESNMYHTR